MKYEVTITRFGTAIVEADSESQAMELADSMPTEDISWGDDWSATDARESEEE